MKTLIFWSIVLAAALGAWLLSVVAPATASVVNLTLHVALYVLLIGSAVARIMRHRRQPRLTPIRCHGCGRFGYPLKRGEIYPCPDCGHPVGLLYLGRDIPLALRKRAR